MENTTNILVIEDNPDHVALMNILNREFNFCIDIGSSLIDFQNMIREKNYDLIICDINMRYETEGLDILKLYKNYNLKSKIVAYTASAKDSDFFINLGFDSLIRKNLLEIRLLFKSMSQMENLIPAD